ncbi:hypothetical protein GN956_G24822 [Arapaima gigas]
MLCFSVSVGLRTEEAVVVAVGGALFICSLTIVAFSRLCRVCSSPAWTCVDRWRLVLRTAGIGRPRSCLMLFDCFV